MQLLSPHPDQVCCLHLYNTVLNFLWFFDPQRRQWMSNGYRVRLADCTVIFFKFNICIFKLISKYTFIQADTSGCRGRIIGIRY